MSDLKGREYLRSRFQNGDCPDQQDFADMIDSCINQKSDAMYAVDQQLGIGTNEPMAPLDVRSARGPLKLSAVFSDGCKSTLRISHPHANAVYLGTDLKDDLFLGNFEENAHQFNPAMVITSGGRVGIGTKHPEVELHVENSIKAGHSVIIRDAVLTFHKNKLWLTHGKNTYEILMEKNGHPHKPGKGHKWLTFALVLSSINFLGLIALAVLRLYHII